MAGYDGSIRIDTRIDGKGFNNGINTISNSLRKFGTLVASVFSITQIAKFSQECVNEASKMQSALVGLQSITEGQGRSFDKARSFINSYIEDGLIPATDAITAYKNLASRGYSDDQIQKTMLALKDSAAFGRQSVYSYGQAIVSATEGLKNENSILVDNAGVTKNVAKMWEDYAKSIGKTTNSLTKEERIQAEVNGILEETKFQTGDAIKYAQTYEGQTARLSASFIKLKQNIGALMQGMFGTVINLAGKAIESINVFVQAIGQVIKMFTGTNPLDNFSNGMKDTSEAIKDANSGVTGIGNSADKSSDKVKKLQKQLTGFDEINKLSDNNTGSSSIGGTGGTNNGISEDIGNLGISKGITEKATKKIEELAKKIKKFLDDTIKILKKYEPLLKGIGTAFLTAFGFKWIVGALAKFQKIAIVSSIIGAIKKAVLSMSIAFALTKNPITTLITGIASLWQSFSTFMKGLPGIAKIGVTLVALVAVFTTTSNAIREFNLGSKSLGDTLLNIVPIATIVGVALTAMLGPWGLLLTAIGLVVGAIVGYNEAQKQLAEEEALTKLFDGQGIAINTLKGLLNEATSEVVNYSNQINSMKEIQEESNQTIQDANNTIEIYLSKLASPQYKLTTEDLQTLRNAFENVKDATIKSGEATANSIIITINRLKELGKISEDTAQNVINSAIRRQMAEGESAKALATAQNDLLTQYSQGKITYEEYTAKMVEAQKMYGSNAESISLLETKLNSLSESISNGINLENPTKLNELVSDLTENYQEQKDALDESYESNRNYFENLLNWQKSELEGLDENSEAYKTLQTEMQKTQEAMGTLSEAHKTDLTQIEGNYKGTFAAIYAQIEGSGKEITGEIQTTKDNVVNILNSFDKDVEITGVGKKVFEGVVNDLRKEGNTRIPEIRKILEGFGINSWGGYIEGIRNQGNLNSLKSSMKSTTDMIENSVREPLRIHSPSGLFYDFGVNSIEGYRNGVEASSGLIKNSFNSLINIIVDFGNISANKLKNSMNNILYDVRNFTNEMQYRLNGMKLEFNIKFPDIKNSCNTLIYQFELMLNRIREGLNNWLYKTTRSLNGLYIYGDGKVGYSNISRISIPRLAKGGITYRPTYAQIGEAGKEAVLPLENNTGWMDILAEKLASRIPINSDSGAIILNNYMDSDLVERKVIKATKKKQFAQNGGY